VTITKVVIFPDDWNRLSEAQRREYTASAAAHGVALTLSPSETINPDHLVVAIGDGDDSTIAAPLYLGPVQCDRASWEHNLRELLEMHDPCFPNPFRDDPGSIRSL
jgi:hypothetical protein